jgi:hypothetical protein
MVLHMQFTIVFHLSACNVVFGSRATFIHRQLPRRLERRKVIMGVDEVFGKGTTLKTSGSCDAGFEAIWCTSCPLRQSAGAKSGVLSGAKLGLNR